MVTEYIIQVQVKDHLPAQAISISDRTTRLRKTFIGILLPPLGARASFFIFNHEPNPLNLRLAF